MSETIGLYSSLPLKRSDIEDVILCQKGVLTPGEGSRIGRVSLDWQHIWLYEENVDNLRTLGELDVLDAIQAKLGEEPRSVFGIEISSTAGSGKLAVTFAKVCATRWPCVVMADQIAGPFPVKVFDKEEIFQLYRNSQGFIPYGM